VTEPSGVAEQINASVLALALRSAAIDTGAQRARRTGLAALIAAMHGAGDRLHVAGSIIGGDRVSGASARGNGDDALVGLAMVCRTGAALMQGAEMLLDAGNTYAAGALNRQLVEVEYLAWAFAEDEEESRSWLRSTKEQRLARWQPRHLRQRSQGRFRGSDYADHCEIGGHPTPDGCLLLLDADSTRRQLLLYEALHHGWSTWRYLMLAVVQHALRRSWDPQQLIPDELVREARAAESAWRGCEQLLQVRNGP
jgi:hypothetical protein